MLRSVGTTLIRSAFRPAAYTIKSVSTMPRVVDAWCQPIHSGFQSMPEITRLFAQSKSPAAKILEAGLGPKETLALLDQSGIEKALLSAWFRPGQVIISNEVIYEYVKAAPDRFVGIGSLNLTSPVEALKEIEKCIKDYGFKGIRILPWLWNMPPTTNYFYPVLAKCVELDVPFCTQVGHTGPLCPSEPGRPIPYIDQIALDFPDLKIVCGHIGYPWTDEMIGLAWKHANVYIDTSAHAPKYYPKELLHFMSTYGQDKIMYGTNFPMLMWDTCTEQTKELPLKEDILEKFLWRNANNVFKLGMETNATPKL